MIEVWNKIDVLDSEEADAVQAQADRRDDLFAVSAIEGTGLDRLLAAVSIKLRPNHTTEVIDLPFSAGKKRAWLFAQGIVDDEVQTEDGYRLTITWSEIQKNKFAQQ